MPAASDRIDAHDVDGAQSVVGQVCRVVVVDRDAALLVHEDHDVAQDAVAFDIIPQPAFREADDGLIAVASRVPARGLALFGAVAVADGLACLRAAHVDAVHEIGDAVDLL